MKRKISQLKATAREQLRGHYGLFIGVSVLLAVAIMVSSIVAKLLFAQQGAFYTVMRSLVVYIIGLLISVLSAGTIYMYLQVSRGSESKISDIVYMFSHEPDRVIVVAFVQLIIELICMIPYYIMVMISANDLTALMAQLTGLTVYMLLTLPLAMAFYLLVDDETMRPVEAIKKSVQLMKGNIGRLLYLTLSFIPITILGMLPMCIGLLWIVPYMSMTQALFYRELIGELDEQKDIKSEPAQLVTNPQIDDLQIGTSETEEESQHLQPVNDGYNAEA